MAEPAAHIETNEESAPDADCEALEAPARSSRGWRDLWQVPIFLVGMALLVGGLMTLRGDAPQNDFDGALDDAETLITRQEFDRAITLLNDTIRPELDAPDALPRHLRRFHLLRGDALYLGQEATGAGLAPNAQAIVDEYGRAEEFFAELEGARVVRYADALAALGRVEEALARADALPPTLDAARRELLKRIIRAKLDGNPADEAGALALLGRLAGEPNLPATDHAWVVARQAELLLDSGQAEDALTHLLRSIQRFEAGPSGASGELYLLVAEAYFELGRFEEASEQIGAALDRLPFASGLRGDASILAGRIAQIRADLEEARDRYATALLEHPSAPRAAQAVLGMAEVDAAMGAVAQSLESYRDLVDRIDDATSARRTGVTRDEAAGSMLERRRERLVVNDPNGALEFAQLAERVFDGAQAPGDVLLGVADAHRRVADAIVGVESGAPDARAVLALDPASRAEARAHYDGAAEYFLRHARRMILTEDQAFGDSLWLAGDSFDLAGDRERAIEVFSEFVGGRPNDPRVPAALFRLGLAHQSLSDHTTAASFFQDLIARHPRAPEAASAHVHLAQCLLSDGAPGNNAEAERLLKRIVDGSMLTPDAVEFREALFELGRLHLAREQFDDATLRLREAVDRYPNDPGADMARFHLAEALRLAARDLEETLREGLPSAERRQIEQERADRLARAQALYEEVRSGLEAKAPAIRTDLDRLTLRNAYFYRADCAFDQGLYDEAIRLYDAAAQRYADEPASLVAMMQIVNCYIALERWPEARTANARARRRLAEIPDSALDARDLPLDRRHWERWLESSERLTQRAEADEGDSG
ncbi:MAG: tetratricopeptide repeat protein [Phycisphaerales bacterium]